MKENLLKKFIKYAGLNMLAMLSISIYILADTLFIAKAMGENGLAALNFSISVFSIINSIGLMIGAGSGALYSINISRNKQKLANIVFSTAVKLALIFGLIFFILGLIFSKNIGYLLGARGQTLELSNIYLKTIMVFAVFFILNNVVIFAIRNDYNPKLTMLATLAGSFSNIVLDYVFIFIFNMGMFGAAFATCLAPVISIIIMISHFIKKQRQIAFLKNEKVAYLKSIVSLGLSSFITEISSSISLIMFNYLFLLQAGNLGVAAYAIVANLAMVVISIFVGISHGLQPLSSKEHGRNNNPAIKELLKYSFVVAFSISVIVYAIFYFNVDLIVAMFNSNNNSKISRLASRGLVIYFIGFLFASINIVASGFFASIEMSRKAFIISVARAILILVPAAFIFSMIFGIDGIWIAFPFTEIIVFLITCYLIKLLYRNFE